METFEKLAIVGLGLIGSSIAHAARRGELASQIAGHDASADVRSAAAGDRLCRHCIADDLAACVADADLVILCTPVGRLQGDRRGRSRRI